MDAQEHRARHIAHNEGKNYNQLSKAERNKCLFKAREEVPVPEVNKVNVIVELDGEKVAEGIVKGIEGVANDDSVSGTGQPDTTTGSPDTSEPKQPAKPKAKRKARKRAKKVL